MAVWEVDAPQGSEVGWTLEGIGTSDATIAAPYAGKSGAAQRGSGKTAASAGSRNADQSDDGGGRRRRNASGDARDAGGTRGEIHGRRGRRRKVYH